MVVLFMRIVIQRVKEAKVEADGLITGKITKGLLVLVAVAKTDTTEDADYLASKVVELRIFPDDAGKMNRSIIESGGALLIVSQFTLYADCRKGRRPSFDLAADPMRAKELYSYFVERARANQIQVETGVFQAYMSVHLVNDGPVTVICDSAHR